VYIIQVCKTTRTNPRLTSIMATMDQATPKSPRQPFRRRRIVWIAVILFALVFFFGAPWEFPGKGLSSISRASIVHLVKPSGRVPDEIYGLLHFVTRDDGRILNHEPALDPTKPMKLSVYEKSNGNWTQHVQTLEQSYPIVVFSKASPTSLWLRTKVNFELLSDILPVNNLQLTSANPQAYSLLSIVTQKKPRCC